MTERAKSILKSAIFAVAVGALVFFTNPQGSEDLSGVDGITVFTVSDLATAIRVAFPADSQ